MAESSDSEPGTNPPPVLAPTGAEPLVSLDEQPIEPEAVLARIRHAGAGAVGVFIGVVRNENEGHPVDQLEYVAYDAMARAEMLRIVGDVERHLPGVRATIAHRIGVLRVGDVAVVCAASAKHRGPAIDAASRLIEEVKSRVPIWKREFGPDGSAWVGWVDARCSHEHPDR